MATRKVSFRAARVGLPGLGETEREDNWWLEPLLTAIVLIAFVVYATYVVLVGNNYRWGPYISPFYSPYIGIPGVSAAMLVAWIPALFRFSCYYYRKAYYRSLFLSPPACAVSERPGTYTGEARAPFSWFSIAHRWLLYLALIVLIFLWADAVHAFNFNGKFGVGIGSLVLLANVILLSGFTFGCHAFRSLVGGNLKCFTCVRGGRYRYRVWRGVTFLNMWHMEWAWISLFSVSLADLYVRLCAAGVIVDPRLL